MEAGEVVLDRSFARSVSDDKRMSLVGDLLVEVGVVVLVVGIVSGKAVTDSAW